MAFATVGSTVFGGVALAVNNKDNHGKKHVEVTNTDGTVGPGGNPTYLLLHRHGYCTVMGVVQTSTGMSLAATGASF